MTEKSAHTMTQKKAILEHLQKHGCITDAEAFASKMKCRRLGARIWDLRHEGYNIITDKGESVNEFGHRVCYAIYRLVKTA